jgi:uroporphyrinogen-III synthase
MRHLVPSIGAMTLKYQQKAGGRVDIHAEPPSPAARLAARTSLN